MAKTNQPPVEDHFPEGLSNPARRALAGAGYTRLEQLAGARERDVSKLHGMGPKGMALLKDALAARGLSFADKKDPSAGSTLED